MNELLTLSLDALHRLLASGQCSSRELTDAYLAAIEARDGAVGAYVSLQAQGARKTADAVDGLRAAGEALPYLAGIPYAAKDNFCTKSIETTCASRMLKGYLPPRDAFAVSLLSHSPLLGKTNLDEFAMGSSCESSALGVTRNPLDEARVAGGSSGGSAAAVAALEAPFALGSDTGGSVRQPAAFCGTVGFKPTRGSISRRGMIAFSSSLDTVGICARTVRDTAAVFEALAVADPADATSRTHPEKVDLKTFDAPDFRALRIGVIDFFADFPLSGIPRTDEEAVARLTAAGATVIPLKIPSLAYALPAYHAITSTEAFSNLARYSGTLYGHRTDSASCFSEMTAKSREEGFGKEVRRRILTGTLMLNTDNRTRYYEKAQAVFRAVTHALCKAFESCDVIITPTVTTPPYLIGEKADDPISMYMSDVFTVPASIAGIPALSLPFGFDARGLPLSVQIMAGAFRERTLFSVAAYLEAVKGGERA